jgi:hypothetical protein
MTRPDLDAIEARAREACDYEDQRWEVYNTDVPTLVAYVRELEARLKADAEIARLAREYMAAEMDDWGIIKNQRYRETWSALRAAVSAEEK